MHPVLICIYAGVSVFVKHIEPSIIGVSHFRRTIIVIIILLLLLLLLLLSLVSLSVSRSSEAELSENPFILDDVAKYFHLPQGTLLRFFWVVFLAPIKSLI